MRELPFDLPHAATEERNSRERCALEGFRPFGPQKMRAPHTRGTAFNLKGVSDLVTGRKLLLADDSVTIQKVIDLTFSDEGIEVTTVGNGEQAILKLEEIEPDIVLADVFMPGRSGYEVCEHIKRDERFRHIPVMLLVGSFEPFDEAEARRVGADDYLTKPFQSIRQLVNKVTSLLGGGSEEEKATTRNLDLPKGLAAEEEKRTGVAESDDIHTADTAPLPQELEGKEPAEQIAHLAGHESIDDEMIETHSAEEIEEPRRTAGAADARPTQPFSAADLEEAGIPTPAQASPVSLQETINDFKLDEMNEEPLSTSEPQRAAAPSAPAPSRYMNNAAAADEALLDLGDIEPPPSTMEADDFILDLQDDEPATALAETMAGPSGYAESAQASAQAYSSAPASSEFAPEVISTQPSPDFSEEAPSVAQDAFATSAPLVEEESAAWEAPQTEGPQPSAEAAPMENAPSEGVVEIEDAYDTHESLPPQPVPQSFAEQSDISMRETMMPEASFFESEYAEAAQSRAEEEQPQSTPMAATQPSSGQITLDQLSPEAIDAIARRAVELLSTKVLEEVAWEVVPQLAELLIKRKLEEEKA